MKNTLHSMASVFTLTLSSDHIDRDFEDSGENDLDAIHDSRQDDKVESDSKHNDRPLNDGSEP